MPNFAVRTEVHAGCHRRASIHPVPPIAYGGTELFVAQLAGALADRGHTVIVYANGESRVRCEVRWLYPNGDWPPADPAAHLRNADHPTWAIRDATLSADAVHLNDVIGLAFTRFVDVPVVLTNHHPHEPVLSAMYERYPRVEYVAISDAQPRREPMPQITVVHHGLRLDDYIFKDAKKATWRSSAGWSRVRARMPRSPSPDSRASS